MISMDSSSAHDTLPFSNYDENEQEFPSLLPELSTNHHHQNVLSNDLTDHHSHSISQNNVSCYSPNDEEEVNEEEDEYTEDVLIPPPLWVLESFEKDNIMSASSAIMTDKMNEEATDEDELDSKEQKEEVSSYDNEDAVSPTKTKSSSASSSASSSSLSSWKQQIHTEFTTTLPLAAHELMQTSLRKMIYHARLSYAARGLKYHVNSDLGNASGYFRNSQFSSPISTESLVYMSSNANHSNNNHTIVTGDTLPLPPFSSLSWVDRQLVSEWRTISKKQLDDDDEYDIARVLVPKPICRPQRAMSLSCQTCHRKFDRTLSRHHCRLCGGSFCHADSNCGHRLPHLNYNHNVPERVCTGCKTKLVERDLAERVAWRMARVRDYLGNDLTPYFETGVDTVEDAALRIARATIRMAKQIPLGAQATVAVETVDVLRRHGLKGVYGLVLRKEFMAAADLLCKVTGINKHSWPLSVHELSAAVFYALAQHRGLRGNDPQREEWMHSLVSDECDKDMAKKNETFGEGSRIQQHPLRTSEKKDKTQTFSVEEKKEERAYNAVVSSTDEQNLHHTHFHDLVDDTDVYNPMDQSYADLLVMADLAIKAKKEQDVVLGSKHNDEKNYKSAENPMYINKHSLVDPKTEPLIQNSYIPPSQEKVAPNHKRPQRPKNPVCHPVSDSLLSSLLFYAPIAMNFIYCTNSVDMQLLAAQQNWHLLYAHLEQDATLSDRPASALFVHRDQKIACFAVRGTATINDVVTDIRAMPVPFPDNPLDASFEDDWMPVDRGQGLALCGMARSAGHLFREHIDALVMLVEKGYRIRITGHSLGGGVAALLGVLVRQFFEKRIQSKDSFRDALANGANAREKSIMDQNDLLRVYTYAIPACVDAQLADFCQDFVTSVVCHDDVVPRLTPTSIRALLKHLLHIRKTWVKAHLGDDITHIADRLKGGWAPRWRGGFTLSQQNGKVGQIRNTAKSSTKWVKQTMNQCKKKLQTAKSIFASSHPTNRNEISQGKENEIDANVNAIDSSIQLQAHQTHQTHRENHTEMKTVNFTCNENNGPDERNMFDGDYFYEAVEDENKLLEEDEDESDHYNAYHQAYGELYSAHHGCEKKSLPRVVEEDEWVPFDEPPMEEPMIPDFTAEIIDVKNDELLPNINEEEGTGTGAPVMLEEITLPRMFIPGKIVHIYTHNGGYFASCVPRTFRELRRISLAGNMLSDHTCKSYYEALLEVRSIRKAPKPLPKWTGFGEDVTCSCCASPFTWASTSSTEAQNARDKHNCRACGSLVCDPCSNNRIPLPQIGLEVPLRVCDRCYFDLGGALNEDSENSLTMSYLEEEEDIMTNPPVRLKNLGSSIGADEKHSIQSLSNESRQVDKNKKMVPEGKGQLRRNRVVDDLAYRIQSSSIAG